MPRIPQPVAKLKLNGTYKPSLHKDRGRDPATGTPEMPARLKGEAAKWWKRVVPALIEQGIVRAVDVDHLEGTAEAYGLYRAALEIAKESPTGAARRDVSNLWQMYCTAANKIGLNPLDRQRLPAPEKSKTSEIDKFRLDWDTRDPVSLADFARQRKPDAEVG